MIELIALVVGIVIVVRFWQVFAALIGVGVFAWLGVVLWVMAEYDLGFFG
jgi:hypothetical protein